MYRLNHSCTEVRNFCDSMPCYHGRCTPRTIQKETDKGYECSCNRNGRLSYDVQTDCRVHPNINQKEIQGEEKKSWFCKIIRTFLSLLKLLQFFWMICDSECINLTNDLWVSHTRIYYNIGWFLQRFHSVVLVSSWFPRKIRILLWKAKTKGYLCVSFQDFWSLSKSSKSDIQKATSAKQIIIWKIFLCKNNHYNVVVLVPDFHLSARSSSFFLAFFLLIYGEPF